MANILDVAKLAGVSPSTVSNVFLEKGNVSLKKIQKVREAAEQLGYYPNDSAKALRSSNKKEIAILLPDIELLRYRNIYTYAQKKLALEGYDVSLYLTYNSTAQILPILYKIQMSRPSGIISAIDLKEYRDSFDYHTFPTVFVDCCSESDDISVGFDYEKCGKEVGAFLLTHTPENVLLYSDPISVQDSAFAYGLTSSMRTINIHRVDREEPTGLMLDLIDLFHEHKISHAVTTNIEWVQTIKKAQELADSDQSVPIISLSSNSVWERKPSISYKLNYMQVGEIAASKVLALIQESPVSSEVLPPIGIYPSNITPIRTKTQSVQLLMLDSPMSRILSSLSPLCRKETGVDLKLTTMNQNELHDIGLASADSSFFDMVRADILWSSDYIERAFLPLENTPLNIKKIKERMLPSLPQKFYSSSGGSEYTLPLDPSLLMLIYRKDYFQDPIFKRMYFEKYKSELTVPKSFHEYNQVAEFFTKAYNPDSPTEYGTTDVMSNFSSIACEFLPRIQELGAWDLRHSKFNPDIYLQCCKEYREAFHFTNGKLNMWWKDASVSVATGKSAMALVFLNHASELNKHTDVTRCIGFSELPGNVSWLGGGILGVLKNGKKVSACCDFIEWIYSDEIAKYVTFLGGFSPCASVYENRVITDLYPWLTFAKNNYQKGDVRFCNEQLFSQREFENVLGLVVRNYTLGIANGNEIIQYIENALNIL